MRVIGSSTKKENLKSHKSSEDFFMMKNMTLCNARGNELKHLLPSVHQKIHYQNSLLSLSLSLLHKMDCFKCEKV